MTLKNLQNSKREQPNKPKIDYKAYHQSKKIEPLVYFLDELLIVNK